MKLCPIDVSIIAISMALVVVVAVGVKRLSQNNLPEERATFMQGCMADGTPEYQCILMWRQSNGTH